LPVPTEARPWGLWACGAIGLMCLWRLGLGLWDATELSTDEAQYWLWGQSFLWGAYSKPPLIGWLIGAVTSVLGDSVAAVRLPAALIHGATAGLIWLLARRLLAERAAAFAALSYALMPAVTLGSALMTTDTPLLFFAALAMLLQHRLAQRPGLAGALGLGGAIGLGLLTKYAMLYMVAGMGLAALMDRDWRLRWQDVALAALVALALIVPHLLWLAGHRFVTFAHVASDAQWQGFVLHPGVLARFLAEQLAVMGPVLFLAWLAALRGGLPEGVRGAFYASVPVLGIVALQALLGRALANWGVGFVLGGVIAAAFMLRMRPKAMAASLVISLLVALALPLIKVWGGAITLPNGHLALARYLGHSEVMQRSFSFAQAHAVSTLAAGDRDLLADLSFFAVGKARIRATPWAGPPRHYWDMEYALQEADRAAPLVLLTREATAPCAPLAQEQWQAGPGFAQGSTLSLFLLPPDCYGTVPHG
jgi:4-amino-4-deoxy-L-arabinose transferase-like glycosyltransferase